MKFDLTNKKAIVTGGGSGIGKAIALNLAGQGAIVNIIEMNLEKMNLNELIDLENKIKIQKNKRVSVWDSFSLINKKQTELKRIENEFEKEIDNLKSNEQKELEKLGFTIVIYDDIKYIGIIFMIC